MISVVFFKAEYSVFLTAGISGVFQAIAVGDMLCGTLNTCQRGKAGQCYG